MVLLLQAPLRRTYTAASSATLVSEKEQKKLLVLGYDVSGSRKFRNVFRPTKLLNVTEIHEISRQEMLQFDPDVVVMSGSSFRALLSPSRLTARQQEILALVSKGLTNREIAGVAGLHERVIKAEIAVLLSLLGASNRSE